VRARPGGGARATVSDSGAVAAAPGTRTSTRPSALFRMASAPGMNGTADRGGALVAVGEAVGDGEAAVGVAAPGLVARVAVALTGAVAFGATAGAAVGVMARAPAGVALPGASKAPPSSRIGSPSPRAVTAACATRASPGGTWATRTVAVTLALARPASCGGVQRQPVAAETNPGPGWGVAPASGARVMTRSSAGSAAPFSMVRVTVAS